MRLLTALEISSNYPNGDILITTTQDENDKWFSQMYMLRDKNIHKIMVSFDKTDLFKGFSTENEAKDKMQEVVAFAIAHVKGLG